MRISDWSSYVCSSDLRLKTVFSNNIRNNFGFLNRAHGGIDQAGPQTDKLFVQEGRKVFKEVVPMVAAMIVEEMETLGLKGSDMRRLWLHQANTNMNRLIAQRVLGHEASADESPTRSEEHTSELQSLMRISYAVFCLKKKKHKT